jgi:alpha-L-fucosidase 2
MTERILICAGYFLASFCAGPCQNRVTEFSYASPASSHDLASDSLSSTWDNGIPLGNGMLGALIWQKEKKLRFSLDRADLWDLRPVREFSLPQFSYSWILDRVTDKNYDTVHRLFDLPYERDPAPTKIPGAALEFNTASFGRPLLVRLYLQHALSLVSWAGGQRLLAFIDPIKPVGWFRFDHLDSSDSDLRPQLIPPAYVADSSATHADPAPDDLVRLGYPAGQLEKSGHRIRYHQQGWGGFSYDVEVDWKWEEKGSVMEGCWSIQSHFKSGDSTRVSAALQAAMERGFRNDFISSGKWWDGFWNASSVSLPDTVLENQWYREMYKFGSASRRGAPPITLQAIWTADDGKLPPWKGDFHHDLNTELSYWPGFEANHLGQSIPFTDWLWKIKGRGEQYTRRFFNKPGLDIPGVTTLTGAPMGGWIQYSLSPTVSCWLGQSFYWQWRYSMDRPFLRDRAYPWMRETAEFITAMCPPGSDGIRKLPRSTSPEIHDNSLSAWFPAFTNYDLSLIRWMYEKTSEMAEALGDHQEARKWQDLLARFPQLSVDSGSNLLVAPGQPLEQSHRHMSNLMAIYPLSLFDWARLQDRKVITASLDHVRQLGTSEWCGYSFAWYGCLLAQAHEGQEAARQLRIFAKAFCLPNSFHVNGDQTHSGYSNFTYRPFTLEGNFAFAQGIEQMLMQSQDDTLRIFPAVPLSWKNVSFRQLRAEGAFLVSASMQEGKVKKVVVFSERGGTLRVEDPFTAEGFSVSGTSRIIHTGNILSIPTQAGQRIILYAGEQEDR